LRLNPQPESVQLPVLYAATGKYKQLMIPLFCQIILFFCLLYLLVTVEVICEFTFWNAHK